MKKALIVVGVILILSAFAAPIAYGCGTGAFPCVDTTATTKP